MSRRLVVGLALLASACGEANAARSAAHRATNPGATSTTTTSVASVPSPCRTGDLDVRLGTLTGGMSRNYIPIVLTNSTPTPCTVQGYPEVSFINAAGDPTGPKVTRWADGVPRVTLDPGRSATATVVQMAVNLSAGCAYPTQTSPTTALRITLPGDARSVVLPYPTNVCGSPTIAQSSVTAVVQPAPRGLSRWLRRCVRRADAPSWRRRWSRS